LGNFILHKNRLFILVLSLATGLLSGLEPSLADEFDDAVALFNSGQYADCIRACAGGTESQKWRESWWDLKLRAELETGRYAEALESLKASLERFSSSVRLRFLGYQVHRLNNQPEDAGRMLGEIEAAVTGQGWRYRDPASRIALGRFFLMRGADPREVLEVFFDQVKKSRPDYVDSYLAVGDLALAKHDYALAAESFELAAKFAPEDPAVHLGLAKALADSDPKRAAEALSKALELNPHHPESLLMKADRLVDSEHYEGAEDVLDKVLEVNPKHFQALAYRAVLAHLEGDSQSEQAWRRAALVPCSTNPEVDHLIGKKLSQKYRFQEGSTYQRQALQLDPDYLPAKMQLSQDLLRLGEEGEGWRLATEVYNQDAYSVAAHNLAILGENLAKFKTIEADGFLLRMDEREAAVYGHRALELLRRARQVLCAKYEVPLEETIVVEIFPDQQDFAVRTFGMPFVEGFLGVCFGRVITANSSVSRRDHPSNWEAVLWHEFCHAVTLHKTRNKMPRWLSEGISVYEETQANPVWGESMNRMYRTMILEGGLTPVSQLSGAFLDPPTPLHLQFAYFESSLVVEFLVQRHGFEALLAVLTELAGGASINEALARHMGSLEELDEAFTEFAKGRAEELAPGGDFAEPDLAPDAGLSTWTRWSREHPNNIAGLEALAERLVEERKWQEAKEPLEKLLEIFPRNTEGRNPYILLATVHRELGETDQERQVLEKLAERDADATDAFLRLVDLCEQEKDWNGLATNADRMLALDPMLRAPYRHLAKAAERLDDRGRAIAAYRALLEMDPLDPVEAHYRLARLLYEDGDLASARRRVLMALEEAPRYKQAQKLLLEIVDSPNVDRAVGEEKENAAEVTP
jgi:tetratricopeptide (TPR) repeat protein